MKFSPLRRRVAFCVAMLLPLAPGGLAAQRNFSPLTDFARDEVRSGVSSGGAVAVVAADSTILVEGLGRVGYGKDAPKVVPDMLFGTADFHDVLTALTTALLAERGVIRLDEPIGTYAPDLPRRLGATTIAQLLSHTAGLDDAEDEHPRTPRSTVWAGATDRALFTEPGAIYSHSRHGYPLVRRILEQQTGKTYTALLQDLIFDPAGMVRSTFNAARAEQLGVVPAYAVSTSIDQPMVRLAPTANPLKPLYSSAGDLARLAQVWLARGVLRGERIFPRRVFEAIEAARAARPASPGDSVGFGVRITRVHGLRELSYAGGPGGYGIRMRLIPEAKLGVVTLANATGTTLDRTSDAAIDFALAAGSAASHDYNASPQSGPEGLPKELATFAGTYANGDRIIVLDVRHGELFWIDADLALPVQRTGSRFEAIVPDGRVAQVFHWTRDAAGATYLIVGERAFRQQPARSE